MKKWAFVAGGFLLLVMLVAIGCAAKDVAPTPGALTAVPTT